MSFGLAKGVGESAFRAAVKTMTIKFIDGSGVVEEADVPMEFFQVPICDYKLQEETMDTPPQNPTQKAPRDPNVIEIKIRYNRFTRKMDISEDPPIGDAIVFKGLIYEALRIFDAKLSQMEKGVLTA